MDCMAPVFESGTVVSEIVVEHDPRAGEELAPAFENQNRCLDSGALNSTAMDRYLHRLSKL